MVESVGVFDTNEELADRVSRTFGIEKIYRSFEEVLRDGALDAVHLTTPIPLHERQTVAVLESGKHCACTVPMAISQEGIESILAAQKKSGKTYMLMETTLYTRQFMHVQRMLESGELGRIQFLRARQAAALLRRAARGASAVHDEQRGLRRNQPRKDARARRDGGASRLAPAHGTRVCQRHHGAPQAVDGCHHGGEHHGDLPDRAPVRAGGRRGYGDSYV